VSDAGYSTPTPIQAGAIPQALQGKDVLGIAQTGTGKTAAFVLPMISRLEKGRARARMPRTLIVEPTRELAAQVEENFAKYGKNHRLTVALLIGGVSFEEQDRKLERGADVLIATPGRLLDHHERGKLLLTGVEILVIDEADRMLDMGFIPDIERICKLIPFTRQTLFFSATMPPPIEALTRDLLRNPVRIALQRKAAPATGVKQTVYPVPAARKGALLVELLARDHMDDALVFTRTKHRADRLAKLLNKAGIAAERIHGSRSQPQRVKALDGFKRGEFRVLVATDIAARGIDLDALGHVVNFDVPVVPEDYIHRVGRTGRADQVGDAFTLVSPEEEGDLTRIERAVGQKVPRVKLDGFDYTAAEEAPLETPLKDRIAAIRARKAEERARAAAKKARRAAAEQAANRATAPSRNRSPDGRPQEGKAGPGRKRRRRGRK
jgi:ATP-dependent RNA helicase RhlE